jgi:hypothetical protein
MAKGQQRSNREVKKPKKDKAEKLVTASASPFKSQMQNAESGKPGKAK